ncbi:MAG: pyridoxal-phosphate dependent enzyme [Gemmatimonadota bacterium]|nr:pyridoxal-phosphate dependent enzyme [Gemmatimonadota bacterium]
MKPLEPVPLEEIHLARDRIAGAAVRTPLVRLNAEGGPAEVWLKLENLQPIGSFKLRGASNALASAPRDRLQDGVYTASAGNMAQGVAWNARRLGVPCRVVVPESAPRTKLDAIARLGGETIPKPFAEWWQVLVEHGHPDVDGYFVHPVSDPRVLAGNATIGLEIVEDLPDVDAVVVAYGGGALSCGIACAVQALKPGTPVYAAEVETAAPFAASLAAGSPQGVEWVPSFVDGIGSRGVLPEMWPLARSVLAGSIVSPLADVAAAVRLLVERNRVVAEGAGAAAVAAALSGRAGPGRVVAVVSGGNIDLATLARILGGADA